VGIAFDESHSPNITTEPLLTERLALVVSSHHPLAHHSSITIDELYDYPLVLLNQNFATRVQIDDHFRHIGIHLQAHTEVDSISAILEIIRQTSLVTIIPENITRHKQDLIAIPLPGEQFERTAILMRRKDAWQSVAIKECLRIAKETAKLI
ncbi:MAG: LysR substrate-binding domain-containing protein, partial [Wohlfahrtiimonas sp.]